MSQSSDFSFSHRDESLSFLPSESQTIHSDLILDLDQLAPIPPTLSTLTTADRITWVVFSLMAKSEFLDWWLTTQYGMKDGLEKTGVWGRKKQNSELWSHFDEVAHSQTRKPYLLC
jgi:hypothetical protein